MNLDKLEIDQISKTSLSKISRVCRYHKFGKHDEPLKILIEDLLKEELPKPIICILEFIKANFKKNTSHSEYYAYIFDCKNTKLMTIKEGIDSLIMYAGLIKKREENIIRRKKEKEEKRLRIKREKEEKLLRIKKEKEANLVRNKIKSFLFISDKGIRLNWEKSEIEICAEIQVDWNYKSEIIKLKREIVKEWFASVNLDIPSDEQTDVIANLNNSLKVVARAGSGKTRTIAQKIIFLIYFIGYSSDQIVSLAFNKKAKKELAKRLKKYETESSISSVSDFNVLTFDSLAYNLVKTKKTVIEDYTQKNLINNLVVDALENEENLRLQVEEIILDSFKDDWEKVLKLDKVSSQSDLERLRSCLTEETLDGKIVKSRAEKRIADYLFEHDLKYNYEFPFTTDDSNIIRPDFYIKSPYKIIIEYCGLKGDKEYEESLSYKREFWETMNKKQKENEKYIVIEIDPGLICKSGTDFDKTREDDYINLTNLLNEELLKYGKNLNIKRLSDQEIISKLKDQIRFTFSELLQSALARLNQICCSEMDLIERLNNYQTDSIPEKNFLSLLPKFNSMYKDRLANNNLTDYSEIKKKAIEKINGGETIFDWNAGRRGIDLKNVKYIFVDEFQDFSELFRGLLLAILKVSPKSLVNAVGDDWQMINRFAGSKPEYFDQFAEDYPNPKTVYLQTNYRSAGGIVDFCNLIMTSNGVFGKPSLPYNPNNKATFSIFSINRDQIKCTPREEYNFKNEPVLASIFRLFKPLTNEFKETAKQDEDKLMFAISRTNNPPLKISAEDFKKMKAKSKRELVNELCSKNKSLSDFFEAVTAHKSKGLEANTVLVLQPKQFPTMHKRSIFLKFFGDTPVNLLRDELNLFYVTCSRAKNHICFLPERDYMMTPFIEKMKKSIKIYDWSRFPCTLKEPLDLHTITITSINNGNGELYKAMGILLANDFEKFSRPKLIPTRSKKVRMNFLNTLIHLRKIIEMCSEFKLKYDIYDGIDEKIYSWPGTQSLESKIEELTKIEN